MTSAQKTNAESLVGCYVRFAHLPANSEAHPVRVIEAVNGMIRLAGWAGYFAPHLFVVVKRPQGEKSARQATRNQA